MSKNRPYIPPPKLQPPDHAIAANTQAHVSQSALQAAMAMAQTNVPRGTPPALAVVAPPARVASVKILSDRIEYENPTIELANHIWLKHAAPHVQTALLTPTRAVVAHGLIVIEEFRLSIPVEGARIRT